ncbi:MAG: GIY-YIG nuclease family protein [Verrucomicrobiales bacterium]|nr:GIY-YIG nuclease family protein [Verrucomicrobiales bacterium]
MNPSVASAQRLLFPDSRPLVERLGRDFFLNLPSAPGVYFMRDASGTVVYVGKAKSLRKRLNSYRVANPDRLPKRQLRMLGLVVQVDWEIQESEQAALAREAALLRELKPRFNRAGTWAGPRPSLAWRYGEGELWLGLRETPDVGWEMPGSEVRRTAGLRLPLARLLWWASHPGLDISALPVGWFHGMVPPEASIPCGGALPLIVENLLPLKVGDLAPLCSWIQRQLGALDRLAPFERAAVEADLEFLAEWKPGGGRVSGQSETSVA